MRVLTKKARSKIRPASEGRPKPTVKMRLPKASIPSNSIEKGQSESSDSLQQLLAMPISERIEAVVKDLVTRKDKFRQIEPHALAEALGVSAPELPGSGERWDFIQYGVKVNIEEYAELNDPANELVYLIQEKVSAERFQSILNYSTGLDSFDKPDFHFLTPNERELLAEAIGSEELKANQENSRHCHNKMSS